MFCLISPMSFPHIADSIMIHKLMIIEENGLSSYCVHHNSILAYNLIPIHNFNKEIIEQLSRSQFTHQNKIVTLT